MRTKTVVDQQKISEWRTEYATVEAQIAQAKLSGRMRLGRIAGEMLRTRKVTKAALATAVGVSRSTIDRWMHTAGAWE